MALDLFVTGTLLETTRETGDFTPKGEHEAIHFDYTALHILNGREVVKVRLPRDVHSHNLKQGSQVRVRVEVPPKTKMTADLASLGLETSAAA